MLDKINLFQTAWGAPVGSWLPVSLQVRTCGWRNRWSGSGTAQATGRATRQRGLRWTMIHTITWRYVLCSWWLWLEEEKELAVGCVSAGVSCSHGSAGASQQVKREVEIIKHNCVQWGFCTELHNTRCPAPPPTAPDTRIRIDKTSGAKLKSVTWRCCKVSSDWCHGAHAAARAVETGSSEPRMWVKCHQNQSDALTRFI